MAEDKLNIYLTQGGIGKTIAFTSILDKLNEKICISSPWGAVFNHHPNVDTIYPFYDWNQITNKIFYKHFNEIIYHEPYYGEFLKGNFHLIEAFHQKYNLKYDGLYHNVVFSEEENTYYSDLSKQIGDFVMVQFVGSDADFNRDINEIGTRNLDIPTAQKLINILRFDFKLSVIDVNNTNSFFENIYQPPHPLLYRDYLNLLRFSKTFISIDSCLNHMSAYKDTPKKGVCLWRDEDYGKLFQYNHNINLYSDLPFTMRFNVNNICEKVEKILHVSR